MSTNKKYNLDKLTESHIDELCKDENVKEILTKAGVVPKPENEIQVNNPQTVEYVQNGVFVPSSVILDTPNSFDLGEVVRRKFNENCK